jgi:transcription elongation factor GreA
VLEGLLPAEQWTAWWGRARKHPRVASTGSGSRLRYRLSSSAAAANESLLDELRAGEPRERLQVARRLAARGEEAGAIAVPLLADSLAALEASDPGLAWEIAGLLVTLPGGADPATACRVRLMVTSDPLRLLAGIDDRLARAEVLAAVRAARGDAWTRLWAAWLPSEEHPGNLTNIAAELAGAGAGDLLRSALETVFRDHLNHPAQLVWACEAMTEEGCPEALSRRMTPSVLEFLLDALGRPEFASVRSRAKALLDGGRVVIRLILEHASPQQATRFEQRLARLPGIEPQRLNLIQQAVRQRTAAPTTDAPMLVASRAAVEARREELRQLLEVEIPRTLKGINAAAAEGDLSENFEYHMLRQRQELFSARAARLKQELARVRVLEPGSANTSRVNLGTVVHLEGLGGETVAPLTILGPWDATVERRVFADGSDLAQGLLGRKAGDEVEVEGKRARITRIEAWSG